MAEALRLDPGDHLAHALKAEVREEAGWPTPAAAARLREEPQRSRLLSEYDILVSPAERLWKAGEGRAHAGESRSGNSV